MAVAQIAGVVIYASYGEEINIKGEFKNGSS